MVVKKANPKLNLAMIISGIGLIVVISLVDGFVASFVNAIQHIISDFTAELKVHAYIAGMILLFYGICKYLSGKKPIKL